MPSRRGIALILTMVVMAVLVTLTAAFVGVNRSNSALTGNTVSRENAFKACQTGLDYAWSQLELDGGFGANGFPDAVVSWSYPSVDPVLRITRHGNTLAPENPDENYLSGQNLANGDSFRISLYNNLNNRNPAEDTPLGDVPGREVRLRIDGLSGRAQRRLDVVLRKSPYVDSSAVSSLDMTVALSDAGHQWRLRSKDPYVNQVRSNTNIFGPSAIDDRLNFRDPPRGGMALAKDDIVLGGTSVKSSPSFLQNSQDAARGSFLVDAPEIPVPDLGRSNLRFPETTVNIPDGTLETTTFERHEWSSANFGVDTTVPPDGIPDTTVTRWRKQVHRHPAMTHDGQTWIAETSYVASDSGPLTGPGSGYASPDTSDGFQDVATQPTTLDDFPVLYESGPAHQMRANLLTGEVALSPATSFEVSGDLTVQKGTTSPTPHLKFGHTMNDDGETSFEAITDGSLSALDDPSAHSSALVASGNLNIGGIASGFGSIFADHSVQLQAKRGLRADPDLAVAVRGESIRLTAEDPPDSAVANTLLETDWKVYQEALGPTYDSFDGWFEQSSTARRHILGDDPAVASGLRTKNLPGDAANYWNQLDAELDLGPAPNFSAPPFGSDWTGTFTLEHYARLRNYATSKKSGNPVNQWLDFDGTYFQNVLGNIDSTILTYSNWASRLDMTMGAYMAEELPLIPDVYFVGLVHAGSGGFFADLAEASILFEGAVVSQGQLTIENTRELDFVYNRLYLDDVVRQFVGDRVKLDQVYFNIL